MRTASEHRLWIDLDSVDSTNTEVRRRLDAGESRDVVVLSREQTAGRGTQGRRWVSPRNGGLYLSIGRAIDVRTIPDEFAIRVAERAKAALDRLSLPMVKVRPINDLVVAEKKLGGILVESSMVSGKVTRLILGVGINIRPLPEANLDGRNEAISVEEILGHTISFDEYRASLSRALVEEFAPLFRELT